MAERESLCDARDSTPVASLSDITSRVADAQQRGVWLFYEDPHGFVAHMTQDERRQWVRHALGRGGQGSKLHEIALLILDEAGL